MARTDIQKSDREPAGAQKWKSSHWYGAYLFTWLRFIWLHLYHSRLYSKHAGLDGFSIRYADGTCGDYDCLPDAHHRDYSEQGCAPAIPSVHGYAGIRLLLFLGVFYSDEQYTGRKFFLDA